ncbi:MAG: hypothetical protein KKG00_14215 [Bacteroidetes bacterium]|nr:hypothetical protein [Bacteroidota bacterium]
MRNIFCVFALLLVVNSTTSAQQLKSDRVGMGISYLTLDLPDDITFLPKFSYQHQFKQRIFGSADIGYLYYKGMDNTFQQVPELRKRFTVDLAAKFSLFEMGGSHLRIAAGPSLWHVSDLVSKKINFNGDEVTDYERENRTYWDFGGNLGLELDINLSKRLSVMGNFQIVYLNKTELTPMLGLYAFYRIR